MLRVIFCLNCCAVPPKGPRPPRRRVSAVENKTPTEPPEFAAGIVNLTAKDKRDYGAVGEQQQQDQGDSFNYTSTQETSSSTLVTNLTGQASSTMASVSSHNNDFRGLSLNGQKSESRIDEYLETSMSRSSSIEIEQFKEAAPMVRPKLVGLRQQTAQDRQSESWFSGKPIDTRADNNSPSTTKIADYARIEYSPVEDLESMKTQSRPGSEKGSKGGTRGGSTNRSAPNSPKAARSSSQSRGIDSSSISIASQLSSELEQKLTNMLESSNSPAPKFGTIGLPLGPPIDSAAFDTAKESTDNGAALTSASQDSLSGNSVPSRPISQAALAGFNSSTGAALVDSTELYGERQQPQPRDSSSLRDTSVRLESSLSMATTTTSTSMNDPTPTPSDMSGSTSSKKRKLTAKGLLKRFKPVRKKKNKDNEASDNKK